MNQHIYRGNFGQITPMPGQTTAASLVPSGFTVPAELTAADMQLPAAPSGTGLSQTLIIIAVLGTVVGVLYMFFNMFKMV